jgi:hypothetical protein
MGTPMVGERGKVRHAPGLRNWHAQLSGAPRSFSEHGLGFGELSSYAMQHGGRDGPQPLSLGVGYGIEQTLRPLKPLDCGSGVTRVDRIAAPSNERHGHSNRCTNVLE